MDSGVETGTVFRESTIMCQHQTETHFMVLKTLDTFLGYRRVDEFGFYEFGRVSFRC
jgi:hypothetical protein